MAASPLDISVAEFETTIAFFHHEADALHAAGVEFDDVRLSYDDFKVSCHGTGGSNRVRFLTIAC